jgi:phytoene desaturase (3,4-didehydrolycopene-forming)
MTAGGSAIVIGAGIAGITAAAHLSRAGMRVTVVEKDAEPGGRCGRLVREGHHFDLGPTLFVMRPLYEAEFGELGESVGDRLELLPVDPTYQLVFDDGSRLSLTADMTSMRDQLEAIEAGSFDAFRRYVRQGGRHYRLVVDKLVNRDFRGWSDLIALDSVRMLLGASPLLNHHRSMDAYFGSSRLKSAFTFQDLYVGLSPFQAPATLSFLPYTELAHGVWYPRGGMYRVVEALVDIAAAAGVELRYDSTVAEIETVGHRARGVRLKDGSRLAADVVLANADLPWVYEHLLPADRTAARLARKEYSCSTISFFWGVQGRYEALSPHTLFLADDFRENFDVITRQHGLAANPSLYVHAPARLDPSIAPPERDAITAIVPVGHIEPQATHDWDALRDQAREQVFSRLETVGVTDIRSRITFEHAYTPVTWAERHNLAKGATHGLSHRLTQMACFRPSNRHRRFHNLYFAGASTHPGTGVPTAMVSGRHVARRVTAEPS